MPDSIEKKRRTKRRGAVLGALFILAAQLASAAILIWGASLASEYRWLQITLWVLAVLSLVPLPFVGIVLKQRLNEIKGGESDAAAQY